MNSSRGASAFNQGAARHDPAAAIMLELQKRDPLGGRNDSAKLVEEDIKELAVVGEVTALTIRRNSFGDAVCALIPGMARIGANVTNGEKPSMLTDQGERPDGPRQGRKARVHRAGCSSSNGNLAVKAQLQDGMWPSSGRSNEDGKSPNSTESLSHIVGQMYAT